MTPLPIRSGDPLPELTDVTLDCRTKGMPGWLGPTALGDIGAKGWNVLAGDLPFPLAVLDRDALAHNGAWIKAVTQHYGVALCPHGKTTMAPQIFRRQIEDGCWGLTLSTPHQVHVARHYGVSRILLANQILDPAFLSYIAEAQARDAGLEFYFLLDSPEGLDLIERVAEAQPGHRPFRVLIEMGSPFGRSGCRTEGEALALAARIAARPGPAILAGIEGFEGSIRGADDAEIEARIIDFLALMNATARAIAQKGWFGGEEVLLTAGGSAYFDLVARTLGKAGLDLPTRVVLRSGCYIAHDAGLYETHAARARQRSPELAALGIAPRQALSVWAVVQSRPAADLVLLNAGRRDVSFDSHLPRLLRHVGEAGDLRALDARHETIMLNDQHAYVSCPPDSPLRPGSLVELGISHPCTTFDKWDVLCVVDADLSVIGAVKTFF